MFPAQLFLLFAVWRASLFDLAFEVFEFLSDLFTLLFPAQLFLAFAVWRASPFDLAFAVFAFLSDLFTLLFPAKLFLPLDVWRASLFDLPFPIAELDLPESRFVLVSLPADAKSGLL